LLGPNGAGKTTTINCFLGFLQPDSGEARVNGARVAANAVAARRQVAYIPEQVALYPRFSGVENLDYFSTLAGRRHTDAEVLALLQRAGLPEDAAHRRVSTYSKGMRQKVLITAGMIHNPDVLFLDEPLSGLDANSVVTVKEIISRLADRGKTIFYCSHVMDVVERVCDRIIIINDGHIIADGSFEQLQASSKAESLERLFTQLTSAGGHGAVADRFIQALEGR